MSADTIVQSAGSSQSLNRYTYVRNSPLVAIDPSGHADCDASNGACWNNEWMWKNRWYEAHGYFWSGDSWAYDSKRMPQFSDLPIFTEILGEAGISWARGDKTWAWNELVIVTSAIVRFAHLIDDGPNGGARLKSLLGAKQTVINRSVQSSDNDPDTTGEHLSNNIWLYDAAFASTRTLQEIYGTVIHELAHTIGDTNKTPSGKTWSDAFPWHPGGMGLYAPGSTQDFMGDPEYFAESVKLWVIVSFPGSYGSLDGKQMGWLSGMLRGFGPMPGISTAP